ncbi:MAG: phage shock protein B [Gammaproteobacteria bacterium]|nr:phage shock protein B [Gammaproteobacteria bacterium]
MYGGKKALVKKGVLPRVQQNRFQRAQVVDAVASREWRIDLPNGVSVAFSGMVDAGALTTILTTAAGGSAISAWICFSSLVATIWLCFFYRSMWSDSIDK